MIPLGILLDVDVNAKTFYEGVETVTAPPRADHYTVLEVKKDESGKNTYRACETVTRLPRKEQDENSHSKDICVDEVHKKATMAV